MRLTPPPFWYDHEHRPAAQAKAASLSAFSALYVIGHLLHQALGRPAHAGIPVICLGNLVVGGGGKTPAALAVMALIRKKNLFKAPCFLTRGYGGTAEGPLLVDPAQHNAAAVGDEPLLLSTVAPTIVSADRVKGAAFAKSQGFDVIVMDDGLQNTGLHKDLAIVVIDGAVGFGNEMLLPAGPLRTPIHAGMKKADAVLIIGADETNVLRHVPEGLPVLSATMVPVTPLDTLPEYVAFCGIARPEKFWTTLEQAELKVAEFHKFADHHPYTQAELDTLVRRAEAIKARLVTTAKDAARLPPDFVIGGKTDILAIELDWSGGAENLLAEMIGKAATQGGHDKEPQPR